LHKQRKNSNDSPPVRVSDSYINAAWQT
jgi:hypothetical protein